MQRFTCLHTTPGEGDETRGRAAYCTFDLQHSLSLHPVIVLPKTLRPRKTGDSERGSCRHSILQLSYFTAAQKPHHIPRQHVQLDEQPVSIASLPIADRLLEPEPDPGRSLPVKVLGSWFSLDIHVPCVVTCLRSIGGVPAQCIVSWTRQDTPLPPIIPISPKSRSELVENISYRRHLLRRSYNWPDPDALPIRISYGLQRGVEKCHFDRCTVMVSDRSQCHA
jgi:hypothetical protein